MREKGATEFDKLCHKVFSANGNGTDFLSRATGQLCRWCGNDLEAYYCENRLFVVECPYCKMRALIMASNAQEAAFRTFGEVSE